jgi:DNA-binding winged helix-turn-helix (wHTH) protein
VGIAGAAVVSDLCICPHCGYDLVAETRIEDGLWLYEPHVGLSYDGRFIPLSPARALLAAALIRARGRTLSKAALLGVMGSEDSLEGLVAIQVCHVRRAMIDAGALCPIETVWGFGYRWIAAAHLKTTNDTQSHLPHADCAEMAGFTGGTFIHGSASK